MGDIRSEKALSPWKEQCIKHHHALSAAPQIPVSEDDGIEVELNPVLEFIDQVLGLFSRKLGL